ncbi:MAG: hypothetical protein R3E10_04385 [Gemmatimonadota bacterium]
MTRTSPLGRLAGLIGALFAADALPLWAHPGAGPHVHEPTLSVAGALGATALAILLAAVARDRLGNR